MITKDSHVSRNGDCIIAVGSDKAGVDLSPKFKEALKKTNSKVTITIEAGNVTDQILAFGSPHLFPNHATDLVVRKSEFVSDRTLAVCADKASNDLPRQLVEKLKDPKQQIKITLIVEV